MRIQRGVSGPTFQQVRRVVVTTYHPGSRYYELHECRSDKRTPQHPRVQLALDISPASFATRLSITGFFYGWIYGRWYVTIRGSSPFNLVDTTIAKRYTRIYSQYAQQSSYILLRINGPFLSTHSRRRIF